jgi:hypothetical protein
MKKLLLAGTAALALTAGPAMATTVSASQVSYGGRLLSEVLADSVNVKNPPYSARGDGSTDDCTAFTAAIATGKSVYVPVPTTAYKISCALTLTANGQNIICDGRGTELRLYYSAGPQIVIGGSASQSKDIGVHGCKLTSMQAGQAMFFTRWLRGFRLADSYATADQLIKLGDSSLGTGKPTYIAELYLGDELHRVASPTMHYVNAENFSGQWVAQHVFYEGGLTANLSGFRCADNIQTRIDDIEWDEGYWSRDDVNLDFTDCRVVNVKILGLQSEGALTTALKFAISSSLSKVKTAVGAEGVIVQGGRYDSIAGPAILVQHNRSEAAVETFSLMSFGNIQITGSNNTTTPFVVESLQTTSIIRMLQINGLNGNFNAANTSQDMLRISGLATSGALTDVSVDNVTGWSAASALRSVLRIDGTGNTRVGHGPNIRGRNATLRVDDQSLVAVRNGWLYKSTTQGFGSVAAGAQACTTVSVSNAATGDFVIGEVTTNPPPAGARFDYRTSATGIVTICETNLLTSTTNFGSIDFLLRVKPADL